MLVLVNPCPLKTKAGHQVISGMTLLTQTVMGTRQIFSVPLAYHWPSSPWSWCRWQHPPNWRVRESCSEELIWTAEGGNTIMSQKMEYRVKVGCYSFCILRPVMCPCCGNPGHYQKICPLINITCTFWVKDGHLENMNNQWEDLRLDIFVDNARASSWALDSSPKTTPARAWVKHYLIFNDL